MSQLFISKSIKNNDLKVSQIRFVKLLVYKMTTKLAVNREIQQIATKVCMESILKKEGRNISRIADKLSQQKLGSKESIRRRLYRYIKNDYVITKANFIDALNAEYKGTKRLLEHPLWIILSNPEASLEEVYQCMRLLHPNIQRHLFNFDEITGEPLRKKLRKPHDIYKITARGDLDALAHALLTIREMELLNRLDAYNTAKNAALDAFFICCTTGILLNLKPTVYRLIHDEFIDIDGVNNKHPFIIELSSKKPQKAQHDSAVCDHIATLSAINWHANNQGIMYDKLDEGEQLFLLLVLISSKSKEVEKDLKSLPPEFRHSQQTSLLSDTLIELSNKYDYSLSNRRYFPTSNRFID